MKKIMIFSFLSIIIVFAKNNSYSQHCPFDNIAILVVDVRDSATNEQIDSIKISLCDSNFIILKDYMENELIFVKNPEKIYDDWFSSNFTRVRYSFAEDNYILPFPNDAKFTENTFIVIENLNPESKNDYNTSTYKLRKEDVYDVHNNIGDWTDLHNLKETPKPEEEFNHKITFILSKK